jgi:hypothetical protein
MTAKRLSPLQKIHFVSVTKLGYFFGELMVAYSEKQTEHITALFGENVKNRRSIFTFGLFKGAFSSSDHMEWHTRQVVFNLGYAKTS